MQWTVAAYYILHTVCLSLEYSYQKIRKSLAQDLLNKVAILPPAFFEKLVVELLVKWGTVDPSRMQGRPSEKPVTKE